MRKERLAKIALVCWIIVSLFGLAALSMKHMAGLPEPEDEEMVSRSLLELRQDSNRSFLVHVIYAECSCSRALFAHLMARHRIPDAEETILFVGSDRRKEELAKRAGFSFITISASHLVSHFGLESAPVLILFDSGGALRYIGGYYSHPATITPLDEEIYAQVSVGANVDPLPVFGCAVSPRLQNSLDPLRLAHWRKTAQSVW